MEFISKADTLRREAKERLLKAEAEALEAENEALRVEEEQRLEEEHRLAEELRIAKELWLAKEQRLAEELRLAEEQKLAEELRLAEEQRLAEELRLAEEQRAAEEVRLAEEKRVAELERLVSDVQVSESNRLAELARVIDEKRVIYEKIFDSNIDEFISQLIKIEKGTKLAEKAYQYSSNPLLNFANGLCRKISTNEAPVNPLLRELSGFMVQYYKEQAELPEKLNLSERLEEVEEGLIKLEKDLLPIYKKPGEKGYNTESKFCAKKTIKPYVMPGIQEDKKSYIYKMGAYIDSIKDERYLENLHALSQKRKELKEKHAKEVEKPNAEYKKLEEEEIKQQYNLDNAKIQHEKGKESKQKELQQLVKSRDLDPHRHVTSRTWDSKINPCNASIKGYDEVLALIPQKKINQKLSTEQKQLSILEKLDKLENILSQEELQLTSQEDIIHAKLKEFIDFESQFNNNLPVLMPEKYMYIPYRIKEYETQRDIQQKWINKLHNKILPLRKVIVELQKIIKKQSDEYPSSNICDILVKKS